jgi:hypothetical protein
LATLTALTALALILAALATLAALTALALILAALALFVAIPGLHGPLSVGPQDLYEVRH